MKKLRVILTGGNGQLGSSIQQVCKASYPEIKLVVTDRASIDVSQQGALEDYLKDKPSTLPTIVLNAAAYTAVDKAEEEEDEAYDLNSFAPGYLALSCSQLDLMLIHISTDYVFDGHATTPYMEDSPTNPISVYGRTKAVGEENILRLLPARGLIVRTSWLYSPYGKNFVKTMIRLSQDKTAISVVNDQTGSPTYAPHLADALLKIALQAEQRGFFPQPIIHFTNAGTCTWYDLAKATIEQLGNVECKVIPISTEEYGQVGAQRPMYSVLSHRYLTAVYGIEPQPWQQGIEDFALFLKNNCTQTDK
jgi:dTDP-4-dehydrorhamnose reductase